MLRERLRCADRDQGSVPPGSRPHRKLTRVPPGEESRCPSGRLRVRNHLIRRAPGRCQGAYPLMLTSPFDRSTVPGAQTWIGLSHEYSGWLVVSVTFSRS